MVILSYYVAYTLCRTKRSEVQIGGRNIGNGEMLILEEVECWF